jgi:hypothetical protein
VQAETVTTRLGRLGMYLATVVVPATSIGALVAFLAR